MKGKATPGRETNAITPFSQTQGPHLWQIRAIRDLFWIVLVALIVWLGYYLRSIFTPVLISFFLAYLVNPLINWMQFRFRIPRPLAISLILFLFFLILGIFIAWFGPLLKDQIVTLTQKIPDYLEQFADRLPSIIDDLKTNYGMNLDFDTTTWREQIKKIALIIQERPMSIVQGVFDAAGQAFGFTSQAVGFIGNVISTSTYILLTVLLMPIYFFFFAWYFDPMVRSFARYVPLSQRDHIVSVVQRMDVAVSGFFRGRVIIAVIMGFLFAFGWFFSGVPYWFLLGMITGILNIFPYVSFIGWPIAIFLKYMDIITSTGTEGFNWLAVFVWPSVVFMAVQFIEGWFLTPWIQSRSTDLSTVTILIVLLVGGALGGLYGLLLAVPVTACIKILLKEMLLPQLEEWAEHN